MGPEHSATHPCLPSLREPRAARLTHQNGTAMGPKSCAPASPTAWPTHQTETERPQQQSRPRILILSDTHSALPDPAGVTAQHAFRRPLPPADLLIHCGDLDLPRRPRPARAAPSAPCSDPHPRNGNFVVPENHDITLDAAYYDTSWPVHGGRQGGAPPEEGSRRTSPPSAAYTTASRRERPGSCTSRKGCGNFGWRIGARLCVYASA